MLQNSWELKLKSRRIFKKESLLKKVDDKNYEWTQEDMDHGVQIIYVEKGHKDNQNVDQIGHAYYMDANWNFVDVKTNLLLQHKAKIYSRNMSGNTRLYIGN